VSHAPLVTSVIRGAHSRDFAFEPSRESSLRSYGSKLCSSFPRRILSLLAAPRFTVNFANLTGYTLLPIVSHRLAKLPTSLNLRNWISCLLFFVRLPCPAAKLLAPPSIEFTSDSPLLLSVSGFSLLFVLATVYRVPYFGGRNSEIIRLNGRENGEYIKFHDFASRFEKYFVPAMFTSATLHFLRS